MSEPVVSVEVEVPVTEPESAPDEPTAVTVVETGSTGVDGDVTRLLAEQAAEIATLRAQLESTNDRVDDTETTALVAGAVAEMAAEETATAVAEVAEMIAETQPPVTSDDDIEPKRDHWFFRGWPKR